VKLKLDENLGRRGREILADAGHDVSTVAEQNLTGSEDPDLIAHCGAEGRCLVTLDLDFSNPLVFLPSRYAGIAVLRLPQKPSHADLLNLVQTLAEALKHEEIVGRLWIVERGRIRIYQEKPSD
jgi:predicted nuclease of predicted toxin-antitoxin system